MNFIVVSCQKEVTIVQRRLTHYRVPLFEMLHKDLKERGIRLRVLHGAAHPSEASKNDTGLLDWAEFVPTRYFFGGQICWQDFTQLTRESQLVVVTQENKLLNNHLHLITPRRSRLAFWGHGGNLQAGNPRSFRERFKRWTTNRVDWWFAYTHISAALVAETGFPTSRITVVNNAVDTTQMRSWVQEIGEEEQRVLRHELGIETAVPVGVFVGSLYADKRLDFLFTATERIWRKIPAFHLLIIGDGPERARMQSWCRAHSRAHWLGPRFSREKAAYVSIAQVMLNPGLVGLGILDSFVSEVPMITTDCRVHSPEIAYLCDGVNGLIARNDVDAYSAEVVGLLRNQAQHRLLREGCRAGAEEYTLENMVHRFTEGITNCLEAPLYTLRKLH